MNVIYTVYYIYTKLGLDYIRGDSVWRKGYPPRPCLPRVKIPTDHFC